MAATSCMSNNFLLICGRMALVFLLLTFSPVFSAVSRSFKEPYLEIHSLSFSEGQVKGEGVIFYPVGAPVYSERVRVVIDPDKLKGKLTVTGKDLGDLPSYFYSRTQPVLRHNGFSYSTEENAIVAKKEGHPVIKHSLPLLSPSQFFKYRPRHHGRLWERNPDAFYYTLYPAFVEKDRIWFSIEFYEGEGAEGVGGIGFFEPETESFGLLRLDPLKECSARICGGGSEKVFVATFFYGEGYATPCSGTFLWDKIAGEVYVLPFPKEPEMPSYLLDSMLKTDAGYWFGASGGIIYTDPGFANYTYWKPIIREGQPHLILKEKKQLPMRLIAATPVDDELIVHMKNNVKKERILREKDIASAPEETRGVVIGKPGVQKALFEIAFTSSQARANDHGGKEREGGGGFSRVVAEGISYHQGNPGRLEDPYEVRRVFLSPLPSGQISVTDDRGHTRPFQRGQRVRLIESFASVTEFSVSEYQIQNVFVTLPSGKKRVPVFREIRLKASHRTMKFPNKLGTLH